MPSKIQKDIPFAFMCLDNEILNTNDDGFGVVRARMARDGVMPYSNFELGLPYNESGTNIYQILTSRDEMARSLDSYGHATLTRDHPYTDRVNITNWDEHAVGEVSTDTTLVTRDDDGFTYAEGTIWVKSKEGLAAIAARENQLSNGTVCDVVFEPGTYTDNNGNTVQYDGYKTNSRVNHLALVKRGRAGEQCSITLDSTTNTLRKFALIDRADAKLDETDEKSDESATTSITKDKTMTIDTKRKLNIGDSELTLDANVADSVEKATKALIATHDKALATANTEHETALGLKDAELVTKTEEVKTLNDELKVFKDAALATERTALVDTAKQHNVPVKDSDTVKDIKLAVLANKMPGKYTVDTADEVVNAVFEAFTVDSKDADPLATLTLGDSATPTVTENHKLWDSMMTPAKEGGNA